MTFSVNEITKQYGGLTVLDNLSFSVEDGRVASILGPSGCGKTTLLNLFSNLVEPDSGTIEGFDGKGISFLFQEPRLLEWKTVAENIDFILKDKMNQQERERIIKSNLETVGLWDYRDYYPKQLSGGMKQRVAIARAFSFSSDILLMDEPFKSLDLDIKASLITSFIDLWRRDRRTVFFVTHDIQAAIILGDDIFVLSDKPTSVSKHITNSTPTHERNLRNPAILQIEKELYAHFSFFR